MMPGATPPRATHMLQVRRALPRFTSIFVALASVWVNGIAALTTPAGEWHTDYDAALTEASREGKDLFVHFSGSDWNKPCQLLRGQILDHKEFIEAVAESFVLLQIDFLGSKLQAAGPPKQNDALRIRFGVEAFPTLLFLDGKGTPFGHLPYQPDLTIDHFAAQMRSYRGLREKRDKRFAEAESKKGLERAKLLDKGLDALSTEIVERFYGDVVDEIIRLDKKDELKRSRGRELAKAIGALKSEIADLARSDDLDAIAARIDAFIAEQKLNSRGKQEALMLKLGLFGPDEIPSALELLDQIVALDPDSENGKEAAETKFRLEQYQKERAARRAAALPKES